MSENVSRVSTLRVHVRTSGIFSTVVKHDASLVMLTRGDEGELMLTYVANRKTNIVPFARVEKIEVVR